MGDGWVAAIAQLLDLGNDPKGKKGGKLRLPTERNFLPVAAHAVLRAIEDAHFGWVFPVYGPVPIRLCALIAAFFAERFFVEPKEVAVPVEEDALFAKEFSDSTIKKRRELAGSGDTHVEMDERSLLDVQGGEIIKVAAGARNFVLLVDLGFLHQTFHGFDIFFAALLR